jgi:putative spermidine/putrescine transport system permease protein
VEVHQVARSFSRLANGLIYLFILSPILVIIPSSFNSTAVLSFWPQGYSLRWYRHFFDTPELVSSLWLSLELALAATAIASALGVLAALAIARHRFPGRDWLAAFFLAPMVVPGLVLGIAFLLFFSKTVLVGSFWALLIAHTVIILPYVIRTVTGTLHGLDSMLEQAAIGLGATPIVAFLTITLPLLRSGIVAGAILAFVTSFDELVVSAFLTGPQLTPLPVQIYTYIEFTSDPTIAAISVVLVSFTAIAVLVTERVVGFGQIV